MTAGEVITLHDFKACALPSGVFKKLTVCHNFKGYGPCSLSPGAALPDY